MILIKRGILRSKRNKSQITHRLVDVQPKLTRRAMSTYLCSTNLRGFPKIFTAGSSRCPRSPRTVTLLPTYPRIRSPAGRACVPHLLPKITHCENYVSILNALSSTPGTSSPQVGQPATNGVRYVMLRVLGDGPLKPNASSCRVSPDRVSFAPIVGIPLIPR